MKKLVVGVSLIVALIVVQTASADSRHYRSSYDRHGYSGHYYSRANPYHFGYGGRITDEDGNEVRVQLEASECSF